MPDRPNLQLFVDTLAHIERDPAAWQQDVWMTLTIEGGKICASAGCMAGWACLIGGEGHPEFQSAWFAGLQRGDVADSTLWKTPDGDTTDIDSYASKLLGIAGIDIDGEEDPYGGAAEMLFSGSNDMDDLYNFSAQVLHMNPAELRKQVAVRVAELDRSAVRRARMAHAVPLPKENGNV